MRMLGLLGLDAGPAEGIDPTAQGRSRLPAGWPSWMLPPSTRDGEGGRRHTRCRGPELGPINRGHRPGVLGQPGQNQENCGVFTAGSWTIVTCTLLLSWSNSQRSASWKPWMACLAPLVDHSLAQADCRGRTRLRRHDCSSASRASCWAAMRGTVNVHCPRLTRGWHLANIVNRRSPVSRGGSGLSSGARRIRVLGNKGRLTSGGVSIPRRARMYPI